MIPRPLVTFLMYVLVIGGIAIGWSQGYPAMPCAIGIAIGVASLAAMSD